MKYVSEITGRAYPTEAEAIAAEKEYLAEKEAEKKAAEEKAAARKERAAEVSAAYDAMVKARENYCELRNQFVKDYGSYHQTYDKVEHVDSVNDLFKVISSLFD